MDCHICLAGGTELGIDGEPLAVVTISDEGAGVPQALGDTVFDRFRKGSPDSVGHGLGLAIVREVVRSHDGHVAFAPGGICQIRVTLPMANEAIQIPRKGDETLESCEAGHDARS